MNKTFKNLLSYQVLPKVTGCSLECEVTDYRFKVRGELHNREWSEVNIFHEVAMKSIEREELIFKTEDLFSGIGGWMGLLIGFSFRDMMEWILRLKNQ